MEQVLKTGTGWITTHIFGQNNQPFAYPMRSAK
jgi:hypothetical protein